MSSSMSSSKQMSSFQSSQTSSFSSAQKIIPNVFIHVIIETNVIFPIFSDLLIFLSPKNHPKCLHPCHHRNKCHLSNLLRPPHFPQPKKSSQMSSSMSSSKQMSSFQSSQTSSFS